jgi:3-hydroxybutyryl-CoA dehydrogenase
MRAVSHDDVVGVLGAGTMGAGIAEVAARAGHDVRLLDARPGAAEEAVRGVGKQLDRDVDRGRLTSTEAAETLARLVVVPDAAAFAGCGVVVEAVVEDLGVKREALRDVEAAVGLQTLIATNTSSISVTAIAAGLQRPDRVVGLHFFNPAARMRLVEVVLGDATAAATVAAAEQLARDWGKTPVTCTSTPGFIVNRIARPFYGEAQRIVEAGATDPATVDAVLREAGGFRAGPFALADLIGQDVNLAVSRSVWEQTFHDPRYAPTVFQQRLVDAGRLGRKAGRGVFAYPGSGAPVDDEPRTEPARRPPARVEVVGDDFGVMAPFLERIAAGPVEVVRVPDVDETDESDTTTPGLHLPGGGLLRVTDGGTARSWTVEAPAGVVLLDWAHDPATCTRVALMASRSCAPDVLEAAVGLCQSAGVDVSVIGDVSGGIVARTVAMLVNEAVDLVARGEATASDVDVAMLLGTGYPSGPLEWGDRVESWRIAAVLAELNEELPGGRYRLSARLDEAVAGEEKLRDL